MAEKDWFRHKAWTIDDQQVYFSHFKRAKKFNKAQYLRIQASHLEDSGTRDCILGALNLLDLLFDAYPEPIELECAYFQQARCLESLNRLEDAIKSYRLAFQARKMAPNVCTDAPLYFGLLVVRHNLTDLYNEVLNIFNTLLNKNDTIFPVQLYMYFSTSAIIANKFGQLGLAKEYAHIALDAASLSYSGFKRHPKIGLVNDPDETINNILYKILDPS